MNDFLEMLDSVLDILAVFITIPIVLFIKIVKVMCTEVKGVLKG